MGVEMPTIVRRRGRVSGPTHRTSSDPAPTGHRGTLGVLKQQSPLPRRAGSTLGRSPGPFTSLPASAVGSSCCSPSCPAGRMAPGPCGHSTNSRRPQRLPLCPEVYPQGRGVGEASPVSSKFLTPPHHRDVGLHRFSPPALFPSGC